MNLSDLKIDSSWTLFLDRDGVINARIHDGYVTKWEEFRFLPGVKEALGILAGKFQKIIVVSNQQGIGKGLMRDQDVIAVHAKMSEEIEKAGGRIDGIYYSPFLESEGSFHRKPNVGMALKARKEFPGIRFRKSVMAGDSISDMIFGRRLGMVTVFLSDDLTEIRKGRKVIDVLYPDLKTFAMELNDR